jgi:hypothetical protein
MRAGVPITMSAVIGLAAGLVATSGVTQELRGRCDLQTDGTVGATDATDCVEQSLDLARGAADGLAEQRFSASLPAALRRQFGQVDRDGDGQIDLDEWTAWFGPAQAEMRTDGLPSWAD